MQAGLMVSLALSEGKLRAHNRSTNLGWLCESSEHTRANIRNVGPYVNQFI